MNSDTDFMSRKTRATPLPAYEAKQAFCLEKAPKESALTVMRRRSLGRTAETLVKIIPYPQLTKEILVTSGIKIS